MTPREEPAEAPCSAMTERIREAAMEYSNEELTERLDVEREKIQETVRRIDRGLLNADEPLSDADVKTLQEAAGSLEGLAFVLYHRTDEAAAEA